MKKFVVERNLPGAGKFSAEEIRVIAKASAEVVDRFGQPYRWVGSFIADDKICCIHIGEDEVKEQAKHDTFPINISTKIKTVFNSVTSNTL